MRRRKKKAAARSRRWSRAAEFRVDHPCRLVDGVLAALGQIIGEMPPEERDHARTHAACELRRAAERYRLDLISGGAATAESLDAAIGATVERARREYLVQEMGGTQPEGQA